jgi:hypothetical protein
MIRFYGKTWMIQHHASDNRASNLAGVDVLDQIGRFINESSNLVSMNMDFVFCYYRSDNKFPNQVFGGAARNIARPEICSEDAFSYFHYKNKDGKPSIALKEPWRLTDTLPQDLLELKLFYKQQAGGIMMDALELSSESMDLGDLKKEYQFLGFTRERHLFSLKRENQLKAVFSLNIADIGLNFSDITNSIHGFIVDSTGLDPEVLEITLMKLSTYFSVKDIPILLYPESYAPNHGIKVEKIYKIWTMDTRYLDYYYTFMRRFFRKLNSIQSSIEKGS